MTTAWIRVSRTCQNACLFCSEQAHLDGQPVALEALQAEIDAAVAAGATKVVLSGGEPTLNKALLGAIRHAKARGLTVAMTTNGRVLQTEKHVEVLKGAGLDEIAVSIHSGRKATHDVIVGREGAWVESLQALRVAGRGGLRAVLKTVLTQGNDADLEHLQHLGTMAGIKEMELRALDLAGAAAVPGRREQLEVATPAALRIVEALWRSAKEEVVRFRAVGFEGTSDLGLPATGERRQADAAALDLLRRRVHLACAGLGFTLLDADGMGKDLVALAEEAGGLAQGGHELAARGAPVVDAPWCVGGLSAGGPEAFAEGVHEDPSCANCVMRPGCGRLPKKLGKIAGGQLGPLPGWSGLEGRLGVVGEGPLADALVAALRAAGRAADRRGPDELGGVDGAVILGLDAARSARAAGFSGRAVVLDDGGDPAGVLRPGDVLESPLAGRVERLAAALPLRQVRWAPPVASPALHAAPDAPGGGLLAFAPGLDDAGLAEAVGGCAVVVLPEARLPLSFDEARWVGAALAGGRPVVAVRRPGVEDLVRHERTGWLVPAGSPLSALDLGRRLLADPEARQRLAAGARGLGRAASVDALAARVVDGQRPGPPRQGGADRPHPTW